MADPVSLVVLAGVGAGCSVISMLGIWLPQINCYRVRLSRWYNIQIKESYNHIIHKDSIPLFYMMSLIIHNTIKKNANFKKGLITLNLTYNGEIGNFTVVQPTYQIKIEIGSDNGIFGSNYFIQKEYLYIYIVGDYNGENIASYQIWTPYRNRDIACKYMATLLFSYGYNLVTSFETFSVHENEHITSLIKNLRIINKNKYQANLKIRLEELTTFLKGRSIEITDINKDNFEEYLKKHYIMMNTNIQRDLMVFRYSEFIKYKIEQPNIDISETECRDIIENNIMTYQTFILLFNNTQSLIVRDVLSSFNIKHYVRLKAEERRKWYELQYNIDLWPGLFEAFIKNNKCFDIEIGLNTMYINFLEKKNTLPSSRKSNPTSINWGS